MSTQSALPSTTEPETYDYSFLSADQYAVIECRKVYDDAYKAAIANSSQVDALRIAKIAYRDALPTLIGATNISRFIACVTQGMLLGIFSHVDLTRLLYAAQVANSAVRKSPELPKSRTKSRF